MSLHQPTDKQLVEARQKLLEQQDLADDVDAMIQDAREKLEKMIQESERAISALNHKKLEIEKEIQITKEFLSPMRRLPDDIIRHVFWECFESSAYAGWRLAAVCSSWRRIALNMPRLWSKIRLVTATHESPDIIRIWVERSKMNVSLDIEIFLEVPPNQRLRRPPPSPGIPWSPPLDDWYNDPPPTPPPPSATQIYGSSGMKLGMRDEIPQLQPHQSSVMTSITRHSGNGTLSSGSSKSNHSTLGISWGYIVFYYLTQQMYRWKRFVFRFQRKFESLRALQYLSGRDAPLLEEFEVSSGEMLNIRHESDCSPFDLLPNGNGNSTNCFPKLRAVTLRHIPFKWDSPLVSGNLRSLQIQTTVVPIGPQSSQITLDHVLTALAANLTLEYLSLSFQAIHPSLLPLDSLALPALRSLHLTGNLVTGKLLEALSAPVLESLTLNMDCETLDNTITQFLVRSHHPPLHTLSIAYDNTSMFGMGVHYPHHMDGDVAPWHFFSNLPQLRTLKIGRTNLDVLLDALKSRNGIWPVPQLEHLALRSCSSMNDVELPKFLQVINERNPPTNGGVALPIPALTFPPPPVAWPPFVPPPHLPNGFGGDVTPPTPPSPLLPPVPPAVPVGGNVANHFERLRCLELYDCLTLGDNILNFIRSRIGDVKYSKPHRYGCGPPMLTVID